MAVLLAALGFFVYVALRHRAQRADRQEPALARRRRRLARRAAATWRANAQPARARGELRPGPDRRRADLRHHAAARDHGRSSPRPRRPRAARASVRLDRGRTSAASTGQARLLARAATQPGGRTFVVVVGASLDDRNEALRNLRTLLLIGGPVALLLASLAGYARLRRALRPVEAMRRRAAAISAAEPEQRLPLPDGRRRAPAPRRDAQRDARPPRGGARARARLRRRRQPRAAHAARLHKTELELALRYAKTPEELRAAIASAIVEVDRLIQLAEDLLVLARSERGQAGAASAASRRRRPARRRPRALRGSDGRGRALAGGRAGGRADGRRATALRLEQALTNLVENAIEHGGGEITDSRERGRRRGRDPRRGPRPGLPSGVPRAGLRALQPRRSGARRGWHRTRPGDRRGDRPRPPRQRPRGEPRRRAAPTSGSSCPAEPAFTADSSRLRRTGRAMINRTEEPRCIGRRST